MYKLYDPKKSLFIPCVYTVTSSLLLTLFLTCGFFNNFYTFKDYN